VNTLQQNEEWFQARRGKFTGSNFKYLIGGGKNSSTTDLNKPWGDYTSKTVKGNTTHYFKPWFGDTGMAYIRKVVAERMGSYEIPTTNSACKWGNEKEPDAINQYEYDTGYTVEESGFVLHEEYDFAGCSVDGLIVGESGIIEVKSPYNPANFIRYATDLSYIEKEHKAQIQGNMWVMESDFCDFIAFDPRNEIKIFIHRFGRDEEYIKKLEDRVVLANQIAEEMYNDILHPNVEF